MIKIWNTELSRLATLCICQTCAGFEYVLQYVHMPSKNKYNARCRLCLIDYVQNQLLFVAECICRPLPRTVVVLSFLALQSYRSKF